MEDASLTGTQVADELGYNIHHLYKLLRSGIVKGERFNQLWMIDREKVERIKSPQGPGGRLPKRVPEQ